MNDQWMRFALCRQYDPDLFFPESVGNGLRVRVAKAAEVCAECPVKQRCGEWADATRQTYGVWAGKWRNTRTPVTLAPHGTPAAAKRHTRNKEPLCGLCRECERIRRAARRERRSA